MNDINMSLKFYLIHYRVIFLFNNLNRKFLIKKSEKYSRFLAPANQNCPQLVSVRGSSSRRATRGCVGYVPYHARFRANREIL
jgi:hypothetical protein